MPVQNRRVKEQSGDHKEQREGGCDVCTSSGKWVLRSAVVQMLINLPPWWGKTCLEAKCCLIEDCRHINKIKVVRTYPYHDFGDLSSQLNSPRGKLRNNSEVSNGFQGIATAPLLSQSRCHQSFPTGPKLELGWMQTFSLSMSLWSLQCLSQFYLAHHEDLLVYKLIFPLLFLCCLRALLGHQLCTQGQVTLSPVTLIRVYLWQLPALQLSLSTHSHPSEGQSHPWAPVFENAEPRKGSALPSSVFLTHSLSSEAWGKNERRRKKDWFRFWQLSPHRRIFHACTWKGILSQPEQRVKITNTNNYPPKIATLSIFLTAATGSVRGWFVAKSWAQKKTDHL